MIPWINKELFLHGGRIGRLCRKTILFGKGIYFPFDFYFMAEVDQKAQFYAGGFQVVV
jgi:hypothetical protein